MTYESGRWGFAFVLDILGTFWARFSLLADVRDIVCALGQEVPITTKRSPILTLDDVTRGELDRLASSRTAQTRMVERAEIVLGCAQGRPVKEIAQQLGIRPNTVIDWCKRFEAEGMEGLHDRPRSGRRPEYGAAFRHRVLALLEPPPPRGQATWDGGAVAKALGASADAVWRLLRKEGICLRRQRSWCVITDPDFAAKAADIIGLCLNPPENALVVSVDDKPSIQALDRATGYVQTSKGKVVRGYKSTYKRHGTLNLFAALEDSHGDRSRQDDQTEAVRRVP